MNIDVASREPDPPRPDLWTLPPVLEVEAVRVHYREPLVRYVGPEGLVEYREAVELLVKTGGPFPIRALSPALFVGDMAIITYEMVSENRYRFYAFEFENLEEGAPIALGWPEFPERKNETSFRYEVRGEEER